MAEQSLADQLLNSLSTATSTEDPSSSQLHLAGANEKLDNAPLETDRESTLSDYGFPAGQKSPIASKSSTALEAEVEKGSLMDRNLACDSKAVEEHVQGKLKIIHSLIIKQAALEHKAEMLALCIAGKRDIPLEWRDNRTLPVLPAGLSFGFKFLKEIRQLQVLNEKAWLQLVHRDITRTQLPFIKEQVRKTVAENKNEIVTEIDATHSGSALELFSNSVEKKLQDRHKQFHQHQQQTKTKPSSKPASSHRQQQQQRNRKPSRRFNPLERPRKDDRRDDRRDRRRDDREGRDRSRQRYDSAGWTKSNHR